MKKEDLHLFSFFIKAALFFNIILIICGFAMLFTTTDTYGIYSAATCSISALFNCIGLTLLLRRYSTGLFFVGLPSLLSAISLSITCAGWFSYYFGNIGICVPYIILCLYLLCIIGLLFAKHNGKSQWQQMSKGLDYKHFRHIYQLSSLIVAVILTAAFLEIRAQKQIGLDAEDDIAEVIINVSLERLDAVDVTIEEIVSFEKQYNESVEVNSRDKKITGRIFALKHLLLSGLMPEIHSRDNLVNICMVHAGEFSTEQQKVIDWYLALDIAKQDEWNVCEKAESIKDFRDKLEEKIK